MWQNILFVFSVVPKGESMLIFIFLTLLFYDIYSSFVIPSRGTIIINTFYDILSFLSFWFLLCWKYLTIVICASVSWTPHQPICKEVKNLGTFGKRKESDKIRVIKTSVQTKASRISVDIVNINSIIFHHSVQPKSDVPAEKDLATRAQGKGQILCL